MAQLLYDRDSTSKHLNATRRHMRLCRRMDQIDMADGIKPFYDALLGKQEITDKKVLARENAYDDLMLADSNLDDAVRNAFAAVETYDRKNPANAVLKRVFPEEKYGYIVKTSLTEEPDVVEELAIRFESLGEDHELFGNAATLRDKVKACRTAINNYEEAVRNVKLSEAEEEIAQAALRRQYEADYLSARMQFGKSLAERLYPKLSKTSVHVDSEMA